MVNYILPIKYNDLEETDNEFQTFYEKKFSNEINHFKHATELLISLFSNASRTSKQDGLDYIQLIAVRILQDSRCALMLALKGLYPQSVGLTRGVLESVFLIYDFKINPKHENIWFNGSKRQRERLFSGKNVRQRVSESGITDVSVGASLYSLLSQWSLHVNRESHIWYLEIKNHILKYHWAGYSQSELASSIVFLSTIFALSQGLFVIAEENLYTFNNSNWLDDYILWKKEHLQLFKKVASLIGNQTFQDVQMKSPKIIIVK